MVDYRIKPEAERDLIAIWQHIAADNAEAADEFLDSLHRASQTLAENPRAGRARNDIARGFRYFPSENYLILYRLADESIEVVRYLHGARDITALFDKDSRES
jgi:toxin ParE1/3/4